MSWKIGVGMLLMTFSLFRERLPETQKSKRLRLSKSIASARITNIYFYANITKWRMFKETKRKQRKTRFFFQIFRQKSSKNEHFHFVLDRVAISVTNTWQKFSMDHCFKKHAFKAFSACSNYRQTALMFIKFQDNAMQFITDFNFYYN